MIGPRLVGAAVLAVGCTTLAAPLSAQPAQRSLYVSVLDASGAPVDRVAPDDLVVREDNVRREVLAVGPAEEPLQVAVLLDDTAGSRDTLQDLRLALDAFVTTMTAARGTGTRNEVALIGFADRPTTLADFTSDPARLKKGIGLLYTHRNAGSYLLDAIVDTCGKLRKRGAARPVILAITTEGVEFSTNQHERVFEALKASGAALHVLTLGAPSADMSTEARERARVFDEGTRDTGGRHDMLLSSMGLRTRLPQVAAELLHQFRVTYAHPQSLIPPDRVTVTSTHPDWTVRGTLIVPAKAEGRP